MQCRKTDKKTALTLHGIGATQLRWSGRVYSSCVCWSFLIELWKNYENWSTKTKAIAKTI